MKVSNLFKISYLFLILIIILFSCTGSPELLEWRGEKRSGIYHETGLLKSWPENGPVEILCVDSIGNGYGSPIITDDHIYISGEIDSLAYLFCMDLSGEIIWKTELGPEYTAAFRGSRSAPTLLGDYIYTGTGMGNLFCINKSDGNIVWSKNGKEDFNEDLAYFGHSEAVLVDNEKVYWFAGGTEHNVVALDRLTGELIWSQKAYGERTAYNSPIFIELENRKLVVGFSAYHLMGLDAATGELIWDQEQDIFPPEKRQPRYGDTHANSPVYYKNAIYYIAASGNGGVRLDLSADGSKISQVWRNQELDGYMGGAIVVDDILFVGPHLKYMRSIDTETGNTLDSLKTGPGALIGADSMIYYYNYKGEVKLISYKSYDIEEVSSFKIEKGSKEHFSHPVIKNKVLYIRHGDVLLGYDIRGE